MSETRLDPKQIQRWDYKKTCRAASEGDINLQDSSDPNPVGGVSLNQRDRVLFKEQSDPTENGGQVLANLIAK